MGWCQDAAIPHGGVGDRGYPRGLGSQVSVSWPKWPLDGWLQGAAIPHDGVGDRGYPRGMGSQLSHQGERRPMSWTCKLCSLSGTAVERRPIEPPRTAVSGFSQPKSLPAVVHLRYTSQNGPTALPSWALPGLCDTPLCGFTTALDTLGRGSRLPAFPCGMQCSELSHSQTPADVGHVNPHG